MPRKDKDGVTAADPKYNWDGEPRNEAEMYDRTDADVAYEPPPADWLLNAYSQARSSRPCELCEEPTNMLSLAGDHAVCVSCLPTTLHEEDS